MQKKSVTSDRNTGTNGSFLVNIVDRQLALLREWLKGLDRIAREVWRTQGETITPDFVRHTLVQEAMALIGARESTVKSNVTGPAQRTHLEDPHDALHHLAMEIGKLKGEVAGRYEIEAREIEYKAPAAQGGPQNQLDELGAISGLIEDAARDATLWIQADPSAVECAHVLAIQERLAGLARIIERRTERRKEAKDDRVWSETVREVLALLDKAREMRGNIVGKGLSQLAERLPQDLSGSKGPKRPPVKLPRPVKPVNTSGGIWLGPPAAQKHHELEVAMEYPGDFPAESRAKVEAARIRAGRRFDSDKAKARWNSDIEAFFKNYVLTMFLVFAMEARRLRLWPVDKMRENCQEFLRLLTIEAYFQKGKAAGLRDMISNWNGSILWEFQQEIEKTPQWRKFENILLKLAEGSTGEKQAESSSVQNGDKSAQGVGSKSARNDPEVAKRAALVKVNPGVPAEEMCEIFDRQHVPLPARWLASGFKTWREAYRNPSYRDRIHTVISKDRRKD